MDERELAIDGLKVFVREAEPPSGATPVLYVHGVPTNSDDWLPFLERTGGIALDLPGFGRSDKPSDFDYSLAGYGSFLEAFRARLGLERYSLVAHDWGAVGLMLAQAAPERVERLVISNTVPLVPGYRWHRIARVWRTPLAGELMMGLSTRWGFKLLSRESTSAEGPAPDDLTERVWRHFDHGTQRAILKLYRSAPPAVLAEAGRDLGALRCPALVLWGADDPYIPSSFAQAHADALGGPAQVEVLEGANHWPWIDRPDALDTVTGFLLGASH